MYEVMKSGDIRVYLFNFSLLALTDYYNCCKLSLSRNATATITVFRAVNNYNFSFKAH